MLKQSLQQKLLQRLSPQQIQLMKLLQVPTAALEQRIKEELEINPALEEGKEKDEDEYGTDSTESEESNDFDDDISIEDYIQDDDIPYFKTRSNNYSSDDSKTEIPIAVINSFHDNLRDQLGVVNITDEEEAIAEHLIGSIDEDGYLRRELIAIVDDLQFSMGISTSEEELLRLLKVIQNFDPPGIGARDLRECLLLQLERKRNHKVAIENATEILRTHMDAFSKKHYSKISRSMQLSDEELKDAIDEILKLNPRPGNTFSDSRRSVQHIVPDFIISIRDGALDLQLNSRNVPDLRVSRSYVDMLDDYNKSKKKGKQEREAIQFVKHKLDSAKWFIDAIKQRQQTLMLTMHAIMDIQEDYFLEGDERLLKPMILKDVADRIGLDISTVSRVANSKYAQTPYGTFLLKSFFSEGLSTESGEEASSREVKKILRDCIDNEDKSKPLPDDRLAKILNDKGYHIARRTIAKYREQLNIPVARLRKEI
ncbi:MAG: RNA polymerase factor sigma-54 [Bacteroidia bacterium]|nr:RNA polymerase factor sigma-54 [Bacteroidia bacterium]